MALNLCIHCGLRPVRKKVGLMAIVRCHKRPGGCGRYVYAAIPSSAASLWNECNPKPPASTPSPTTGG